LDQQEDMSGKQKLRVASCQFPVAADVTRNARYVRRYMKAAAEGGAHLLHTSETCLSGYAGMDFPSFDGFDWDRLRAETARLRDLAAGLGIWLVLGSSHYLDKRTPPTNCLYLIDPKGRVVDRYDKCMLTGSDRKSYSAGNRLVTRTVNGVTLGFAVCYDVCYPQIYAAYREKGVQLMIHSFYNAGHKGPSCLDVLNTREVPTRCADNCLWAVANNSSRRHSNWGSFVARPDATIARQLPQNRAGMLVHDFPDGLSAGGWIHNVLPMRLAPGQGMTLGKPSRHPRQADGTSEP
jgi:predicted amidohydrolase